MESHECCLQRYGLYCVSIPLLNAEMKPVLPLPVETEHLVVMTLQFLDGNLSVELLVPTNGNTVRDCFAAKSIKMSIAVYYPSFIMSLYYFYCNSTQRHLQGLGTMVSKCIWESEMFSLGMSCNLCAGKLQQVSEKSHPVSHASSFM